MKTSNPASTTNSIIAHRKRIALYARVSTQEQTKGQYPSCDSQIEELEAFCRSKGWEVYEAIKDEGWRAGTLKRPGLTRLRFLIETRQVEGVVCTWYNRLIGSRDFYILDKEFKTHDIEFATIHDPTDRYSASGRFMETLLVAAKTFENEQIGEKVRTKMRMRAEKGLWNGGLVPFGFRRNDKAQALLIDPEKSPIVSQLFQVYVDQRSDFAVRDWLKAHQIPAPNGRAVWTPSSIRDLLMNRRYIAEIEVNKKKKGLHGLSEVEAYRIVPASYEPLVSRELFELAQAIRQEKAQESPHRKGKTHGYSQNKCNRVFPLQGRLFCGECGHAMTPYYVVHKPGKNRRNASYIYYYMCSQQIMSGRQACGHSNRVLAKIAESWISAQIGNLGRENGLLERGLEMAWVKCQGDLQPQQEALVITKQALQENQTKIDTMLETISSGGATGPLLAMLNEKAATLNLEREKLRAEQRHLTQALAPLEYQFEALPFRAVLARFSELAAEMEPQELQKLLQMVVHQLEWLPDGSHRLQLYYPFQGATEMLSNSQTKKSGHSDVMLRPDPLEDWLERNVWTGCPHLVSCEPMIQRLIRVAWRRIMTTIFALGKVVELHFVSAISMPFHPSHHQAYQPLEFFRGGAFSH